MNRQTITLLLLALASLGSAVARAADSIETLRDQAEWQEQAFRQLRQVVEEPRALAYLHEVAERMRPQDGSGMRVAVYRHADAFAFSLANGAIYLSSGLLTRIATESELAAILAREMELAAIAATADSRRWTGGYYVLFATLGREQLLPGLWAPSTIRGVPEEAERAADAAAVRRLADAGYDPVAAATIHRLLADQTRVAKARQPFAYADAAGMTARADSLAALARDRPAATELPDRYTEKLKGLVADASERSVRFGRPELAIAALARPGRADALGAVGHRVLADAYRLRGSSGDPERARQAYARALATSTSDAYAHLGYARLLVAAGDLGLAREHFDRFLRLAPPEAGERAIVAAERAALGDGP
jgi:predicted Zn-dependent protease